MNFFSKARKFSTVNYHTPDHETKTIQIKLGPARFENWWKGANSKKLITVHQRIADPRLNSRGMIAGL
jgi:hypothetical protein